MKTMGHMPMFTQKLSNIFHFFDLDQIPDMCNFGVSTGILPLIKIVWIKQHLFWRFEEKSKHMWWSYFTKCTIFKFPKFHLYMDVSIVEIACDNQFLKLSHGCDTSYWTNHRYELSNHINHIFWHHMVVSGIASCHMKTMGHMAMFTQKLSEIFHLRYSDFFNLDQISDV